MSEESAFRTPPQELNKLTKQIAEISDVLKEMQRRLASIERHAKRAFARPTSRKSSAGATRPRLPREQPTFSAQQALTLFDGLVEKWRQGSKDAADADLSELTPANLALVAAEVGLTGLSKMGRKAIGRAILGRVQEAVMLSRNVNVTTSLRDTNSQGGSTAV